ncbi:MAG: hypothetical protein WA751_10080 [Candidatus Dormiibacterota bacterium]
MQPQADRAAARSWGWIDRVVGRIRPDRSPVVALVLLLILAGPVVAYCVGGVPHVGRVGLAGADVASYHLVVNRLLAGVMPYSATFHGRTPFIYPPGIFAFIVPPIIAGGHYTLAFAAEMLALILLGAAWLARVGRSVYGEHAGIGWATLALLAAAGPVTLLRPDPAIGILLAGSVLAWQRRHRSLAFVLIALAGLIKDYGWVALIPMLALQLGEANGMARTFASRIGRVLGSAVPAIVLVVVVGVIFAVWSHGDLIHSQLLNGARGVELESLAAGLLLALTQGRTVVVFRGQLGNMLLGGPDLHLSLAVILFVCVGALATGLVAWRAYRQQVSAGVAVAAVVAAALVATPVLSPQYLDALLPCLVLAAAELGYPQGGRLLCLGLAIALVTQLEFPYLWLSAVALHPYALAVLELRNLLLVVCLVVLVGWHRSAPALRRVTGDPDFRADTDLARR